MSHNNPMPAVPGGFQPWPRHGLEYNKIGKISVRLVSDYKSSMKEEKKDIPAFLNIVTELPGTNS